MKKLFLISIFGTFVLCINAQPRSIGLRLGGNQEISFQQLVNDENGIVQVDAGSFYFQGIQLTATYNWLSSSRSNFSAYGGFGVGIGYSFKDNNGYPHFFDKNNPSDLRNYLNRYYLPHYFFTGIAGHAALEYAFDNIPLALSLDYRPLIGVDISKNRVYANGASAGRVEDKVSFKLHKPGLFNFGLSVRYMF
jgi:hypothetical protein